MPTVHDLLTYIFDDEGGRLRSQLETWSMASRRFRDFAETYRDKIRKKLRHAQDEDSLKDLVSHYVQEKMKGLTPQQIARFLPPKAVTLDEITLNVNWKARRWQYKAEIISLVAVAEPLGLGPEERHETAIAALLHDIGMARLPAETLVASPFTDQDRARVRVHPMEGARVLLSHGEQLESAAVVAYEHHLRMDGGGYPRLSYPREPHALTRVIAVCGAFDALLAHRPDRAPLEPALALRELERNAVTQFDGRVVGAFAEVMLQSARRGRLALTLR